MSIKQKYVFQVVLATLMVTVLTAPMAYADCDTLILPCEEGILGLLKEVIKFMTGGIGVLGVGGIIYGSFLYATAEGSIDQTKQAKRIILNVAIGLVAFALMFALLNFLIPGGVIG